MLGQNAHDEVPNRHGQDVLRSHLHYAGAPRTRQCEQGSEVEIVREDDVAVLSCVAEQLLPEAAPRCRNASLTLASSCATKGLMKAANAPALALTLAVSPSGLPRLVPAAPDDDAVAADRSAALLAAFEGGPGAGVLHLGAVEVGTDWPPPFSYYRELGHELVARVCAHPALETLRRRILVEPPLDWLERLADAAPPMRGAEYVTAESLATVWREANQALGRELTEWRGPVAEWLHAKNAATFWMACCKGLSFSSANPNARSSTMRSEHAARRASRSVTSAARSSFRPCLDGIIVIGSRSS